MFRVITYLRLPERCKNLAHENKSRFTVNAYQAMLNFFNCF